MLKDGTGTKVIMDEEHKTEVVANGGRERDPELLHLEAGGHPADGAEAGGHLVDPYRSYLNNLRIICFWKYKFSVLKFNLSFILEVWKN